MPLIYKSKAINNHNMKIIYLSVIALTAALNTHAETSSPYVETEKFYDLFAGTIINKDQQLYLHACKTVDAEFKLSFNHMKDEQHIRKLMQTHHQFWLNVRANAEIIKEENVMTVDAIEAEHLNQTCHLNELLRQL